MLKGSGGGGGGSLGAVVNDMSSSSLSSSSSSSEDPNLSTLLISCDMYVANYTTHTHELAKLWFSFHLISSFSAHRAREERKTLKTRGINLVF